jgi:predicted ribosomally synthesized peptide with nif11-like leader
MSLEGASAFVQRMELDEAFRARVEAADSPEEKYRVVSEAGYDITPDDLVTIKQLVGISELSDEDLESVAAGALNPLEQVGIATGATIVGLAALAAAVV